MAAGSREAEVDDDLFRAAFTAVLRDAPLGIAVFDRDLRYLAVNDALATVNGVPAADHVGRSLDEVVPDLPPGLVERLRRLASTGEGAGRETIEVPTPAAPDLTRRFDISLQAIHGRDGELAGVLALVDEQTEQHRAMEVLTASELRYRSLVEATSSLVWTVQPGDAAHTDWLEQIHPDDRDRVAAEWVAAVEATRTFEIEMRVLTASGIRNWWVRAVPVLDADVIREWIGASTDITEAREAEAALRASEARLRLAVQSGGMGMWDVDFVEDRIRWSAETAAIYGMRLEDFGGTWADFTANVHPDDVRAIEQQIAEIRPRFGAFEYEMRVRRDGGWNARILSRGQILPDVDGNPTRMVGMVADVTEQARQTEQITQILESIADAFFALDADWRFTYVNAEGERLLRRHASDLIGTVVWDAFPEALGTDFEASYARAMDRREVVSFEAYYAPLNGWFDLRVFPTSDGISVFFRNIDAQRAAEDERRRLEAARQAAADRTARLGALAAGLAEALLEGEVVDIVLQNATEALGARRGAVALFDADGNELRFVSAGWPENSAFAELRSDLTIDRPMSRAARDRTAVFVGSYEELREAFPGVADLFAAMGDEAIAAAPLLVHGQTLGALTLAWPEPRTFSDEDRSFIAAFADTCAQALERARLYEREHRVAETLQIALLPERLADPEGITTAARYLPGTEGVAVGGDWYDVFDLGDARLGIALGDVVGKGVAAAAVMGRLRNALRAYATATDGPADVLTHVDDFAIRFGNDDLATVVYAVLDTGTGELRFSSAGHLPPLIVEVDGAVTFLDGAPDVPVGVDHSVPRSEHRVRLPAAATLLLYSDGLVEDRTRSLDDGLARLAAEASAAAAGTPEETCTRVVQALVGEAGGDDDVAVLALRWAGPKASDRCTTVLPPVVASARRARALITEQLEAWGEEALVETAQLCVSEIVTNAVVHAATPVQLDIRLLPAVVRVEVGDGGAAPPERIEAQDEDVHGRGIAIVELLAAAWGVEPRDEGKCVWFELARRSNGAA